MKRLIIMACLISGQGLAVEAPSQHPVDMTKVILDAAGRPVVDTSDRVIDDKDCLKCPSLTVGRVASLALNGSYEDERNLGWQQRYDRSALARRIRDEPAAVLDSTETAVIERVLAKAGLNGALLLQVIETIDPNAKPGKVQ